MSFKYYLRTELELETELLFFPARALVKKGGSGFTTLLARTFKYFCENYSLTANIFHSHSLQNFASLSGQTRSAPTPPRLHSSPLMVQAGARDGPASYRRSQLPAKATHSKSVAAEQLYLFILRMHWGFCFAGYPDGCLSGHLENSKANQF